MDSGDSGHEIINLFVKWNLPLEAGHRLIDLDGGYWQTLGRSWIWLEERTTPALCNTMAVSSALEAMMMVSAMYQQILPQVAQPMRPRTKMDGRCSSMHQARKPYFVLYVHHAKLATISSSMDTWKLLSIFLQTVSLQSM